jgi:hypothetical protein
MLYHPLVSAARTIHDDSATRESANLLARLCSLVAVGLAHLECHPKAYDNPSGEVLRAQIVAEAKLLFRREHPDESIF